MLKVFSKEGGKDKESHEYMNKRTALLSLAREARSSFYGRK
jgi:hypothetical protein